MPKTERLEIHLTPELKERVQAAAESENRAVSSYVETLIKREVNKKGGFSASFFVIPLMVAL